MGHTHYACGKCGHRGVDCGDSYYECASCETDLCEDCATEAGRKFGWVEIEIERYEGPETKDRPRTCWLCTEDPSLRTFKKKDVIAFLIEKHGTTVGETIEEMKRAMKKEPPEEEEKTGTTKRKRREN